MESTFENINEELNEQLKNPIVAGLLNILLILYAGLAAPELPSFIKDFFNSSVGKVIFLMLIALTANKNITIALLIAICFIITLNYIDTDDSASKIVNN